jgi:class 3 adenylate cyclase
MGTYVSLYTRQRSMALLEAAALEQSRRERLGRYFSPHIAAALVDAEADLGKGEQREVSVLFTDIRDFTALSERLRGDQVVDILNEFHSRMVECIFGHGGTLDKYLGDGLMAYFGAPLDQPDHADRAVLCALDMQQSLDVLNRELEGRGLTALRMGIGVHSGPVILGDIGAARRREFTIIGDTVNVAARVEQLTKVTGAQVLVTEETRRKLASNPALEAVEPLPVKGKSAPLQTYRVLSGSGTRLQFAG